MAGLLGGVHLPYTLECHQWDFVNFGFGLNGYGPPASPPLPPYQHGTPPEQPPSVSTASSASKATKNGGFRTHFPPFELPTGALMLLHAQLPMRDDAARGKKQQGAAPGRAQCRCTKTRHQRGAAAAPEGRTWPRTAPTCSTHGGSRAAPRPAVRAQRRRRARKIVQGAAPGRAQCRCTNNQGLRGAAAPEWRIWPTTAPALD